MDELLHFSRRPPPAPITAAGQLVQGAFGPEVVNLQRALNYHLPDLTPPLPLNGNFGPQTHARVVKFQELNKIPPPRGVVGPRTRRALYSFVRVRHHVLHVTRGVPISGRRLQGAGRLAVGDNDIPLPSVLPEVPRIPFPFPETFTLPTPPQLQLDPRIIAALRNIKVEVEAGHEAKFRTTLGGDPQPAQLELFFDAKATVWSKPLAEGVEASAGSGVLFSKRLFSPDSAEVMAYIWAKAEVEAGTVQAGKMGPVTIAKLQAEGQIANGAEDMSLTVTAGPEAEAQVGGRKITFGPGIYAGVAKDKDGVHVEGGVKFSATLFF